MKVTILGPNLPIPGPTFHVHEAGCADLKHRKYRGAEKDAWPTEATTYKEVVTDIYPPDEFDYNPDDPTDYSAYGEDVKFFDCTKALA